MRGLFNQAFTPRMVAQPENRVAEMTTELLDDAGTGEVDVVVELSYRLPVTIIAEILGIPPADENMFMRWPMPCSRVTGQEEGFPEDHVPTVADALSLPLRENQDDLIGDCQDLCDRPGDDLIAASASPRWKGAAVQRRGHRTRDEPAGVRYLMATYCSETGCRSWRRTRTSRRGGGPSRTGAPGDDEICVCARR